MRRDLDGAAAARALLEDALASVERAIAALDKAGARADIAAHLDQARHLIVADLGVD